MTQRKSVIASFVATLVIAGLGYAMWRFVNEKSGRSCRACVRAVHSHMKTVAILNGQRANYCCPACALSEHQQSGKQVQVVELTDYLSNATLKPGSSFLVRNSDVNPCFQHRPAVGEHSQPLDSRFDRCSPSVLAFQDRESAVGFAGEHGGQVVKFSDFASQYQR